MDPCHLSRFSLHTTGEDEGMKPDPPCLPLSGIEGLAIVTDDHVIASLEKGVMGLGGLFQFTLVSPL
jgi:hypothetical protein